MSASLLTNIGFCLLFLYGFGQIMTFYGVGMESYFDYYIFIIFLMINSIVLPHNFSSV